MSSGIGALAEILEHAGVQYAVIGAHAVNVWLEPRFTSDIDVTVQATAGEMIVLKQVLAARGFSLIAEQSGDLPAGPDFLRFTSSDQLTVVELQVSKTVFQQEVLRRARREAGVRIASPEDLIIMKLIADRPKDHVDLLGLVHLPELDWTYIDHWAGEWDVLDRLALARARTSHGN